MVMGGGAVALDGRPGAMEAGGAEAGTGPLGIAMTGAAIAMMASKRQRRGIWIDLYMMCEFRYCVSCVAAKRSIFFMKRSIFFFGVLLLMAGSCKVNPYRSANRSYRDSIKVYARVIRQTPLDAGADSVPSAPYWV